jgi:recombination protein RecA
MGTPAQIKKITDALNKKYGESVIFSASDKQFKIKRIPTGVMAIDILLGGGMPLGKWVEIFGDEDTLKTTLACFTIASAQKMGFPCLFGDAEQSITKEFLELRGVDTSPEMLMIIRTNTGEEMVDVLKEFLKSGYYKVIVIDSIAALLPQRESKIDHTKEAMGAQGLLMSRLTRVLNTVNKSNACIIMINQTRQKIGLTYGDPTTTPGGKAAKFYAGQRIRLVSTSKTRGAEKTRGRREVVSREIVAELVKDKTGPGGGKEAIIHYDVVNNKVAQDEDLLAAGLRTRVIKRQGRGYKIGKRTFMYKKDILKLLNNNKKTRKLRKKILGVALGKE